MLFDRLIAVLNSNTINYTHNANNELTVAGAIAYSYDANGNTIQETNGNIITQYTYDSSNRLTAVSTLNSQLQTLNSVEYKYDPFGRRISKTINSQTTYYLYSDEGLIGEYDSSGNLQKAYGWTPDSIWGTNPVFMTENNQTYFYHNDHLGTPQKMTDINGNVVWSATYTAFGEATVDSGSTIINNLRFAGQYFDEETGKHYNWNRYYDPKTGRYTQVDPIGFGGRDANLYRYVGNRANSWVDPLGLDSSNSIGYWAGQYVKEVVAAGRGVATGAFTGLLLLVPGLQIDNLPDLQENFGKNLYPDDPYNAAAFQAGYNVGMVLGFYGGLGAGFAKSGKSGCPEAAPKITKPYKRPSGSTTPQQRATVQNKPCYECGKIEPKMYADHKKPLVEEYYETGNIDTARMRDIDSVQPHCPTCSSKQGARLRNYSRKKQMELGL